MENKNNLQSVPLFFINAWQYGDWRELSKIENLDREDVGYQLCLMSAVANIELGNYVNAREAIKFAKSKGASNSNCINFVSSYAHNSIACAEIINKNFCNSKLHFDISVDQAGFNESLDSVVPIRIAFQCLKLGITPESFPDWNLLLLKHLDKKDAFLCIDEAPSLLSLLFKNLRYLINKVIIEKNSLLLDGIKVFEQKDPFLSGKLFYSFVEMVVENQQSYALKLKNVLEFDSIKDLFLGGDVQTWGADFYIRGLSILKDKGLLSEYFNDRELEFLKEKLDWRDIVSESDYNIKKFSNNFYVVAYSIAYHRCELGWDSEEHYKKILGKIINHYKATAGEFGFADETKGKGRYDRYSFLLIAEIATRFNASGLKLPAELKQWLRNSAEYVLANLNSAGDGFQFGRSIGAYGDTAFIEILSAAALSSVLNDDEKRAAYTFSFLSTKKFLNYWWDKDIGCVNLWNDGRTTEKYRGKHRILGESLSLLYQHIYTQKIWSELGFSEAYINLDWYEEWLKNIPRLKVTHVKNDKPYNKLILTWRSDSAIFNLPLINGAEYFDHSTYLPTPYSSIGIHGLPDLHIPLLAPKIYIDSAQGYMSICNFQDFEVQSKKIGCAVSWSNKALVSVGTGRAEENEAISSHTMFFFTHNSIQRTDSFFGELCKIKKIVFNWPNMPVIKKIGSSNRVVIFDDHVFHSLELEGCEYDTESKTFYVKSSELVSSEIELSWKVILN